MRDAWRTVLLCLGANVIGVAGAWFVNTFMLNYTTPTLGLDRSLILGSLFVVALIQLGWPLAVFYSCLAGISLACIATLERRKRGAPHGIVEIA